MSTKQHVYLCFYHIILNHVFCNLESIERSALSDLITAYPEVQAIVNRIVLTDTANLYIILARGKERCVSPVCFRKETYIKVKN